MIAFVPGLLTGLAHFFGSWLGIVFLGGGGYGSSLRFWVI